MSMITMKAMSLFFRLTACGVILALLNVSTRPGASAATQVPKNIIILIGDGMGYNHSLAASYYLYGGCGHVAYEDYPVQYPMSTYSADGWGYNPALARGGFSIKWQIPPIRCLPPHGDRKNLQRRYWCGCKWNP
jgi:alkaline phosphatase